LSKAEVVVREARPEDDAQLGELLVKAFVSTYERKMPEVRVTDERKAELRNVAARRGDAAVFVAESGGKVVGTVAVFPPRSARSEAWKPNSADIRHLAVEPEHHGSGIAARLMNAAEARAREWKVSQICLHVRRGAHGIARMYQSRGYVRDESGDLNYPSVYLEAFHLPL
jgi:GNAT superfamily N-acetyltransferase